MKNNYYITTVRTTKGNQKTMVIFAEDGIEANQMATVEFNAKYGEEIKTVSSRKVVA